MESGGDWPNIYDAASDSSSASVGSNMSTSASKSSNDDLGECLTSTSDAMATRSGAILTSVSALEDHDYHQVGPMLMSPPADASPDPTGDKIVFPSQDTHPGSHLRSGLYRLQVLLPGRG